MNKVILFALIGLVSLAACANYSVLIAGSNGFENYRHQADVCHAYQTLIKKGFLAENIIVFLFNDVANDKKNPFKGKLFNHPNGEDVYAGCKIDYQGNDVTPKNYVSVLTGDKAALANIGTGRVLESTQEDNVFLYFTDHGAPGIIGFPTTYMYANDLISAFQKMHDLGKYKQLVYYLETCESGSMFVNLPTNLNIYAVSAANPTQSSYAAYCGLQAIVKGKLIGSCLGDLFSVNWMEQVDSTSNLDALTLDQQFKYVAKKTNMSQVMQWGDVSFTSEPVSQYLTNTSTTKTLIQKVQSLFNFSTRTLRSNNEFEVIEEEQGLHAHESFVDSRKAKISYLLHSYTHAPSAENFETLSVELHNDQKFQLHFDQIQTKIGVENNSNGFASTNFTCYKNLVESFEAKCGRIPDSQLGNLRHFYQFCSRTFIQEPNVAELLEDVC